MDYADLELDPRLVFGQIEADSVFAPPPERPAGVDPEAFKAAMRVLAGGVVMVTARTGACVWGLTISSCCSITPSPPQILISLAGSASALPAILETGRFGVSILRGHQKPLAELGAVPGGPKHVDAFLERRDEDQLTTMLAGALYHLDCRVEQTFGVADHTLIVGAVEAAIAGRETEGDLSGPLVYFDRTFYTLGRSIG
jgi:flavin reductase (DIM6/NTAB) family NADH-FMN oxidoreductase RutF